MKKAVVTLSKVFFPLHSRKGEETHFKEKVISGEKIHTCRRNSKFWATRLTNIKDVGGVLSLRQWSGKPYRSNQEIITEIPAENIGFQTVKITRIITKIEHFAEGIKEPFATAKHYEWFAEVDERPIVLHELAKNDGLTEDEFKEWFNPVFDSEKAETLSFIIIHFTNFRY